MITEKSLALDTLSILSKHSKRQTPQDAEHLSQREQVCCSVSSRHGDKNARAQKTPLVLPMIENAVNYMHTTHISCLFSSFLPTACICKSPSDEFYISLHAREKWFWCLVPNKGSGQGLCRHADFSSLLLSPRICLTNKCYNPPANYWLCTLSGLQHRRKRLFYCCWEKMQIEFTHNTPNVFYELWCPVPGSAQIKMCLNLVISVCIHYMCTKTFPHTCRACV